MTLYPNLDNKVVKIKETSTHRQVPNFGGSEIHIEGLWSQIHGTQWYHCESNIACVIYGLRCIENNLPIDDAVYYGKINGLGHLVHISELEI